LKGIIAIYRRKKSFFIMKIIKTTINLSNRGFNAGMGKCIADCISKFSVIVKIWKLLWKSSFFTCLTIFLNTLLKNVDGLDWPYENCGKTPHSRFQMNS